MSINSGAIETLLKHKAAVIINANHYSPATIEGFIKLAKAFDAKLTIKVGSGLSSPSLESIAKIGGASVTFDLS